MFLVSSAFLTFQEGIFLAKFFKLCISALNLGFEVINSFMKFFLVFSESSDLHFVFTIDTTFSLNLKL